MAIEESSERARLIPTLEETEVGADASSIGIEPGLARGTLSTGHILFMIMAAIAPAAGAIGLLPLAIGLGVGVGTPGVILLVGLVLLCFAVGFTRMVPLIRNAGAFYAFIRKGLGRTAGLVAAFVALSAYIGIGTALVGAFGFFANITVQDFFGVDIAWPIWVVICVAITFALGYFRVTLAAGVLSALFIAEFLAVLVLDIAILAQEGLGSFADIGAFDPSNVFIASTFGVTVIYAFSFFQGFEGTAIYAEEAKEPNKTVPRATYLAIISITLWYVLTTSALLVGGGGAGAPAKAIANPGTFVYGLTDTFVGSAWTQVLQVLIVTSMFAGVLAFHNASTRYMFSLARDGFLPNPLARVHKEHHSPSVAGVVNAVLMLVIAFGFAIAGLDPLTSLSTSLTGFGAVGVLSLVTFTSISVAVYFIRERRITFLHVGMPIIGAVGVGAGLVLSLKNYSAITGTDDAIINGLPWLHVLTIVVVVALSSYVRRTDPARWERASGEHDVEQVASA